MPNYKLEGEYEAYLCKVSKLLSKKAGKRVSKTEVLKALISLASGEDANDTGPTSIVSFYEPKIKVRKPKK